MCVVHQPVEECRRLAWDRQSVRASVTREVAKSGWWSALGSGPRRSPRNHDARVLTTAMAQSSITKTSMLLSRASRLRRLPSARAIAISRNRDWAHVYSAPSNIATCLLLSLHTDNLLAGKLSSSAFEGAACHCVVQRRSTYGNHSRRSRTRFRSRTETVRLHRGTIVRLHRNPVRDHPGTPFGIIPESRSACPGFPTRATPFSRMKSLYNPETLNFSLVAEVTTTASAMV